MARIEKYLAAGSRVVVRTAGKFSWYQTRKDVSVPNSTDAQDPMNPDGPMVKYAVIEKVAVWFPETLVRTRVALEDGDVDPAALTVQYAVFHYDVPETFNFPYGLIYSVASRMSKSCWIMRAGDEPLALMGRILDAGGTCGFDRYDPAESRKHACRMVEGMLKYVQERIAGAEKSRKAALAQLEGAAAEGLTEKAARDRYETRIKAIERGLAEATSNVTKSMALFGVKNSRFINVDRLDGLKGSIRTEATERARAYNHAAALLAASTNSDAQAMAVAAQNSLVPPEPMADMLQEIGQEAAGVALANTFAESNEFSLVDGTE